MPFSAPHVFPITVIGDILITPGSGKSPDFTSSLLTSSQWGEWVEAQASHIASTYQVLASGEGYSLAPRGHGSRTPNFAFSIPPLGV